MFKYKICPCKIKNPSSADPTNPNGHNVTASLVNNNVYVNDDNNPIFEVTKAFVQKQVSVIGF